MKKLLTPLMAFALAIVFTACQTAPSSSVLSSPAPSESSQLSSAVEEGAAASSQLAEPSEAPAESSAVEGSSETGENSGVLIAYFSWTENAVLEEGVDAMTSPSVSDPGNVQQLAGWIQEETGGELFEIAPATPYTEDYNTLLDVAQQEQADNARPELASQVENWDSYSTVFVGYPDWWSDAPMLIYSFLEFYDWEGKTLIPFCTSGGSGFGRSLDNLPASAPGATILEGFHVNGSSVDGAAEDVAAWLSGLGL